MNTDQSVLSLETWYEELATCQEEALETYLETGTVSRGQIRARSGTEKYFRVILVLARNGRNQETF